jgi:predicted enzyme related to lactoylglutathione lyase
MGNYPTINTVVVDALEPDVLAAFWSQVLGRRVAGRTGPYVWLERDGNSLGMGFQQVDTAKSGKNRLHLDIAAEHPGNERERIEGLGGRLLTDYQSGGFLVMADPEGNEFCVIPTVPFDVDDDGRTSYLEVTDRPG